MNCPYLDKCVDEYIKCKSCIQNEKESYYASRYEFPVVCPYPSPTSIEWPYLPSGDDLRFQTGDDLRFPIDSTSVITRLCEIAGGDIGFEKTTWG